MNISCEEIVVEMDSISEALNFISESIECHAAEGKNINHCGLAYLTRLLGKRSSHAAESCWEYGSVVGPDSPGGTDS